MLNCNRLQQDFPEVLRQQEGQRLPLETPASQRLQSGFLKGQEIAARAGRWLEATVSDATFFINVISINLFKFAADYGFNVLPTGLTIFISLSLNNSIDLILSRFFFNYRRGNLINVYSFILPIWGYIFLYLNFFGHLQYSIINSF